MAIFPGRHNESKWTPAPARNSARPAGGAENRVGGLYADELQTNHQR